MQKYQDYKGASGFCNKKIAFWGCLLQKPITGPIDSMVDVLAYAFLKTTSLSKNVSLSFWK